MTRMIAELRRALVAAGAPEEQADAAAAAVAGAGEAATKADLADVRRHGHSTGGYVRRFRLYGLPSEHLSGCRSPGDKPAFA